MTVNIKIHIVSIVIQSSNTVPANFFGDLGYAMALAAAENHENIVAETLGVSQSKWRLTRLEGEEGFPLCSSVKSFKDFKRFRKTIESVANSSNFDRKSSVFLQKEMKKLNFNPLINYCKGIGIGCSQGVAGFSNHFSSRLGYEVSITYTEDKKVLVSIGMVINRTAANIWKKVIKSVLDVEEENILFKNINAEGVDDFGPNTMSRKLGIVPQLLLQACEDIKRKMEFSRLPLTVTTQSEVLLSDPFYTSTFFGSMVIEIHLDTISLLPVIDRVWASLSFGRILSKDLLEDTIRRSISATISELCPVSSGDFELKLELLENPELPITSGTSAIKAITASALTNAISQAVGHRIKEIPITEEDFFNMTRKKYAGGSK
ncbi:MAG: molybdopterin-dependent oxidoreductase [Sphaerochaetaceae bacterium]|nr:molybdopterin-dependent oxidoreductase [Sphaerochaetaceae bacterium]